VKEIKISHVVTIGGNTFLPVLPITSTSLTTVGKMSNHPKICFK